MALPQCEPFSTSLRVHALEGFTLADRATDAYDAVVAACAAGGTIKVQGQADSTLASVPCKRPLKSRPPWYELRD